MCCTPSLLVLLASCAACAVAATAVPFATLAKGFQSGVREPTQIVIRSRPDWVAFWERHTRTQSEPPPIDFSRDMVVGLALGQRSTGGYEIEITRVERADSRLGIYYRSRSPDPGAILTQALTQPFHVIKLPRDDGPVVFVPESPSR